MPKSLRFIQCGDLHLGSPFHQLAAIDKRWQRIVGKATVRAFQKIVQLAIEKQVHAVLITGDVYTSSEHNLSAQLDYIRLLHKLAQNNIQVFAVLGSSDSMEAWQAEIPFPPNVHIFPSKTMQRIPLYVDGEEVAAIYGQSYAKKEQKENLAWKFNRESQDRFAIGMLYTQAGSRDSLYAPCTLDDLKEAGMDYWALGHNHEHQIVCQQPYVVYAGSPQGLSPEETGPRGCYYVEVGPYGTTQLQFIDTSIVRWESIDVPIDDLESVSEVRDAVRFAKEKVRREIGKPTLLTVNFTGAGSMYHVLNNPEVTQYWREGWRDEEQGKYAFVMIENLCNRARPKINMSERSKVPDSVGDYLKVFDELEKKPAEERVKLLRTILQKRPEFTRLGDYGRSLSDQRLLDAFERAKWLGVQKLMDHRRG